MRTTLPHASLPRRPRAIGRPLVALAFSAALLVAAPLPAAEPTAEEAQELVRSTTESLFSAVEADRAALESDPGRAIALVEATVSPHIDLERSARGVLGKHWRGASPEQRARFVSEFRQLLLRTYATAVTEYDPATRIDYLPPRARPDRHEVTVRTRLPRATAPPISIDYRLYVREGAWKVFDVTIEGVSLVTTYRSSFSQEVRLHGLDGLIQRLAEKNATTIPGA